MAEPDGTPTYRDYADYMVRHQRRPGVGPLAGWRGEDGAPRAAAPPTRTSSTATSRTAASGRRMSRRRPPTSSRGTPPTRTGRWRTGFYDTPAALPLPALRRAAGAASRPPPSARATRQPPDAPARPPRPRHGAAAGLVSAALRRRPRPAAFPLHAITQRPAAMYHSWGSQNAWLRQIHGAEPALRPRRRSGRRSGFEDGDWADVVSPHGRITVPVARMDAQNPHTVWTWNAIGKRPGAWALDPDAPGGHPRLPAQPPDPRPPAADAATRRTPTRSPARPPGTTSASASSASPPAPAPPRLPAAGLSRRPRPAVVAFGEGQLRRRD